MSDRRSGAIGIRILAVILMAVSATALWLVSASALWSKGTGTPFTLLAWWDATQWWRANWWVSLWLVLAAAAPTIFLAMLLFGPFQVWRLRYRGRRRLTAKPGGSVRAVERGVTDKHGHMQWRSMADARKLFHGPHPLYGGIVVGEAYRVDQDRSVAGMPFNPGDEATWGMGGKAPLLIDPCTEGSGHSLVFAGPGGFKTTSVVSTVLTWIGSSVILDPSVELGPMLDGALRRQRKQIVHIGIPGEDDTKPAVTGFNVLAWIDITHPEAELHVRSVVSWIYDEAAAAGSARGEDPFFAPMGWSLVTCLLAHLVWSDPEAVDISLATLAAGISVPEDDMLSLLAGIRASSRSRMARRIAGTLMKCKAGETFSGVYLNAVKGIEWPFTGAYADLVSVGDFDPRALLIGRTTVFLNIGLRTLETPPAIARVLVGALLNTSTWPMAGPGGGYCSCSTRRPGLAGSKPWKPRATSAANTASRCTSCFSRSARWPRPGAARARAPGSMPPPGSAMPRSARAGRAGTSATSSAPMASWPGPKATIRGGKSRSA